MSVNSRKVNAVPDGYWNGYLSQTNILECANVGEKRGSAIVLVIRDDSSLLGSISLTLDVGASTHLILNELHDQNGKGLEDSYGTYRIAQDEPIISCIPILYKYSKSSANRLDYVLAPPVIESLSGTTGGIYNSYDPNITITGQRHPTYNWLTISNISESASTFIVRTYDSYTGARNDEIISVPSMGRRDIALGHQQGERIGTFTITPKSENAYHAFLSRYHQNQSGNFDFGFSLTLGRSLCGTTLPVSTMNSTTEWLHLANPSDIAVNVSLGVYDQSKNKLSHHSFQLDPYLVKDVYLNTLVDPSGVGTTGSIAIDCLGNSLTGFIGNYGNVDLAIGSKQWAYVTLPNIEENRTSKNFIPLNTYLSAYNWLVTTNSSSPNSIDTTIYSQSGSPLRMDVDSIDAFVSKHVAIHEILGLQATGMAKINSTFKRDSRLLRVYQGDSNKIDTILSLAPFNNQIALPIQPTPDPKPNPPFPKDRSFNQRRIGFTKEVFEKLSKISYLDPNQLDNSATLLRNFQRLKGTFDTKLNSADSDFSSNHKYRFCIKAVSSMGILSALGDDQAFQIAKKALLNVATPFTMPRMSSSDALQIFNDKSSPNPSRIVAFNVLKEAGLLSQFQKGGDRIFLDTGLESACLAIGYDWLYSKLSADETQIIEKALREVLLWSLSLNEIFFGDTANPVQKNSNWNPVMNGGAGLAALVSLDNGVPFSCDEIISKPVAISELYYLPLNILARQQVCWSITSIEHYWNSFTSSGVYLESPTYWYFGMEIYAVFRDAVNGILKNNQLFKKFGKLEEKSSLVQDNLMDKEGNFWNTRLSKAQTSTKLYNYGDASLTIPPSSYPFLSIGRLSNNEEVKDLGLRILNQQLYNENGSTTLWTNHDSDWSRTFSLFLNPEGVPRKTSEQPLSTYVTSDHRFDVVRMQAKSKSGKWIVYQKGGSLLESHSHHDSSSFVLDIDDIRWLSDFGLDRSPSGYYKNYFTRPSTPSYQLGLGFFRKNDLSHNLVSLEGRTLNIRGLAKLVDSKQINNSDGSLTYQTNWDTTTLYSPLVIKSSRTMQLTDKRNNILLSVHDILDFKSLPKDLKKPLATWHVTHCVPQQFGWTGSTEVTSVGAKPTVVLSVTPPENITKKLNIRVNEPLNAAIEIISANPNTNLSIKKSAPTQVENSNDGCSIISVKVKGSDLLNIGEIYRANFSVLLQQE